MRLSYNVLNYGCSHDCVTIVAILLRLMRSAITVRCDFNDHRYKDVVAASRDTVRNLKPCYLIIYNIPYMMFNSLSQLYALRVDIFWVRNVLSLFHTFTSLNTLLTIKPILLHLCAHLHICLFMG